MTDLAERVDVEQTAIGKMAATLERDGLVSIRRSRSDGRSRVVDPTDDGRALLDQAIPLWREAQREFEDLNGSGAVSALRSGFSFPGPSRPAEMD